MKLNIPIFSTILFSLLLAKSASGTVQAFGKKTNIIYTQTNSNDTIRGNEILALHHNIDEPGQPLTVFGRFPTGGVGSSSPIGSQDSMIVHNDHLLAINTISHDISVFDMHLDAGGALELVDIQPSQGLFPVGLAAHNDLVYVLNSWDQGSLVGYTMDPDNGKLTPIDNSTRIVNAYPWNEPRFAINTEFGNPGLTAHEAPSQVGFSPDGNWLISVNKGSDFSPLHEGNMLVYRVDKGTGLLSTEPVHNYTSSGNIRPFSFVWTKREGHDVMIRTEADGISSTSYRFESSTGALIPITEHLSNGEFLGLCWNVLDEKTNVMWGTNAPNGTVSSYRVLPDGSLELQDSVAHNYGPLSFPFDVAVEGEFFYSVQAGSGSVAAFEINQVDGTITLVDEIFSMNKGTPSFNDAGGLIGLIGGTAGGLIAMELPHEGDDDISVVQDVSKVVVHQNWGQRGLRGAN